MTITIVWAEASAPIRWWCTVCDDEGVISNWADTPYDLRRRRLSVAGTVDEVIVSDEDRRRVTRAGVARPRL